MNEPSTTPTILTDDDQDRAQTGRVDDAEVSALARQKDPSLTRGDTAGTAAKNKARGVDWVRPSDLMVSRSGRLAGRGIDFQAELSRRTRHGIVRAGRATGHGVMKAGRGMSERARRLPPASAFGRGSGERFSWVSRSGIGLG
jgi:hypothetical protein